MKLQTSALDNIIPLKCSLLLHVLPFNWCNQSESRFGQGHVTFCTVVIKTNLLILLGVRGKESAADSNSTSLFIKVPFTHLRHTPLTAVTAIKSCSQLRESSGQLEPWENSPLSKMNQSSRKMSASAQTISY